MDKILSAYSYGICVFSLDILQDFLKKEKIRTKKFLEYLQKNPNKYLDTIKEGVWIPFVEINSIKYIIRLEGYDPPFNNEWEQKIDYSGFNINIKDSLWISDTKSFCPFNREEFMGNNSISYEVDALIRDDLKKLTVYSAFKYEVVSGKYLLSIKGYKRKQELEFPNPNCGFLFSLVKVDEFKGFNNPREDELYDFNVANM